jgi:hypothetical protein
MQKCLGLNIGLFSSDQIEKGEEEERAAGHKYTFLVSYCFGFI